MTATITKALADHQVPITTHLWSKDFPITFTPVVLGHAFGDGRALFRITTINGRPRWWLIRGCSTWSSDGEGAVDADEGNLVIGHIDAIVQAIADEFGGLPGMEDDDEDDRYVDPATGDEFDPADIVYPQIDDRLGSFWERIDWPEIEGVALVPHPFDRNARILAQDAGI